MGWDGLGSGDPPPIFPLTLTSQKHFTWKKWDGISSQALFFGPALVDLPFFLCFGLLPLKLIIGKNGMGWDDDLSPKAALAPALSVCSLVCKS